ncbi:MAG: hypothetical protein RIQ56_201 [Candidatus Parcubacteria bacterium]|jgi:hypothetical protein
MNSDPIGLLLAVLAIAGAACAAFHLFRYETGSAEERARMDKSLADYERNNMEQLRRIAERRAQGFD